MCRMEDDPSTYDEEFQQMLELADTIGQNRENLPPVLPIVPKFDEDGEFTEIALPVFNRHVSIGEPPYEILRPCTNPDCACKGPSFRNQGVKHYLKEGQ